jgi:galactose mutarotase-like enzyme
MAAFPFPHRVSIRVELGAGSLVVETAVRASGAVRVPVSFGFHPYLRLPGLGRSEWRVSLPPRRHLLTDARSIPTGTAVREAAMDARLGDRAFDDGYTGLPPRPSFGLRGGGRTITVVLLRGYPAAQVFAPPDRDFICFEPMTAPTNALVTGRDLPFAAPGKTYTASFEIRVDSG